MTKNQPRILTPDDVRDLLISHITRSNGANGFASLKGVSSEHIVNVLIGRRQPSKALATALGLEMRTVTTYETTMSSSSEAIGRTNMSSSSEAVGQTNMSSSSEAVGQA